MAGLAISIPVGKLSENLTLYRSSVPELLSTTKVSREVPPRDTVAGVKLFEKAAFDEGAMVRFALAAVVVPTSERRSPVE